MPYFKKSEDTRIAQLKNSHYHSTGGYLPIEEFRYQSPISDKLIDAGSELGYDRVDINGAEQTGFSKSQATLRDGLRCDTAKAFLRGMKKRSNLHVSLYSQAVQIIVDNSTKKAHAVLFQKFGGAVVRADVTKEIVLSAGAISSPQVTYNLSISIERGFDFSFPIVGENKNFNLRPVINLPISRRFTEVKRLKI